MRRATATHTALPSRSPRSSRPGSRLGVDLNIYHAWCDLKPGIGDLEFSEKVAGYMGHLKVQGLIEAWRLTRRKLGVGPWPLVESCLMIEVKALAHVLSGFDRVAGRREPVEGWYFG